MKNNRKKALIIALITSVIMLGAVALATYTFSKYALVTFDTTGMIIGDAIGFLIVFLLVYRFVAKPVEVDNSHHDHNIY